MRTFRLSTVLVLASVTVVAAVLVSGAGAGRGEDQLGRINHIVVIYEENHSFDNLYGGWEGVNGLASADTAHTTQVSQDDTPFSCLLQKDVNLALISIGSCTGPTGFPNTWFTIDNFIPATAKTCPPTLQAFAPAFSNGVLNGNPAGLAGGCTRDIVHRFYQEQFQLDNGKQDRYALGSDAAGLTMGVYDTQALPIYKYLHQEDAPHYAIADDFFQAAFGGSFLQHQWLIAAATPTWPGASATAHALLDVNGFPNATYPLYHPATTVRDGAATQACGLPTTVAGYACGDYAVNTTQPAFQPSGAFGAKIPPQTNATIGDRLNAAHVDWAWYAGGWSNANGDVNAPGWTNGPGPKCSDPNVDPMVGSYPRCPNNLFQYHHQPFNYYAAFDPSTPAGLANRQAHLKDEQEFIQDAHGSSSTCNLKAVSFVKPIGQENEHPGYASEPNGSDHLVALLKTIESSACAKDTMVIVTYDEFGGQWDHVPPPGQGGTPGPHDQWGPGTRIPTLIVSPFLRGNEVVDHTQYDTTSILATIEERWNLAPLGTRDAAVASLADVFGAKQYEASK